MAQYLGSLVGAVLVVQAGYHLYRTQKHLELTRYLKSTVDQDLTPAIEDRENYLTARAAAPFPWTPLPTADDLMRMRKWTANGQTLSVGRT
jgi:hypothetical protein